MNAPDVSWCARCSAAKHCDTATAGVPIAGVAGRERCANCGEPRATMADGYAWAYVAQAPGNWTTGRRYGPAPVRPSPAWRDAVARAEGVRLGELASQARAKFAAERLANVARAALRERARAVGEEMATAFVDAVMAGCMSTASGEVLRKLAGTGLGWQRRMVDRAPGGFRG
jgi:hypothetical protein